MKRVAGRGPPRGQFSRSRSLEDLEERFGPGSITGRLEQACRSGGPVRLLEIGCGEGRVLLQLRKLFPSVELHGINRAPWPAMRGPESLREAALHYGLFTASELDVLPLPVIHFLDAQQLPFPDAHFDMIVSQVAIPYVARKDRLVEEVWRTLKPGAAALLNLDSQQAGVPDFMEMEAPRFVIYRTGRRVPLGEFFAAFQDRGFSLRYSCEAGDGPGARSRSNMVIVKSRVEALGLGLSYDRVSSFELERLVRKPEDRRRLWGHRSVFRTVE